MNRDLRQATYSRDAENSSEAPFDLLVGSCEDALSNFGRLRGWIWSSVKMEPTPGALRAAAKALRDACDALADMPEKLPNGERSGATLQEKTRMAGALLVYAVAYGEDWLGELGTRLATRAAAVHRSELVDDMTLKTEIVPAALQQGGEGGVF